MTFSLLGRCKTTGRLGMVIASSSPAVAARCAHARPSVGLAASQNVTDPRLGLALLDALERTGDPQHALDTVVAERSDIEHRQLVVLDAKGRAAAYTGSKGLGVNGHQVADRCAAAGNLLASEGVLDAMITTFIQRVAEDLGDRLIAVLKVAVRCGGEAGPVRSAGLLMTGEVAWPIADLRVDWHEDPVAELSRIWDVYRPQLKDYVTRALEPDAAPGYGVPGE